MNEVIFLLSIIITFTAILLVYKFFGKAGIYSWICFSSVVANVVVVKTVDCFGLTTTLGNVLFGSIFLATDILSENFGKKEANRAVVLGLISNVAFILITQVVLLYKPSSMDFTSQGFETIFSITPRVCLGSIAAYAFGNFLDVMLFDKLKKKQGDKNLWLRNNLSTITSQLLDNFILHTIAFLGIISFKQVVILSVNVWLIEIIIAVCDTPFLYFAKNKLGIIK